LNIEDYPYFVRKIAGESLFLVYFPDLPGCMSWGETKDEAMNRGFYAARDWLEMAKKKGIDISTPTPSQSGKWVQRVPKSWHAKLVSRAKEEGVSLNTLVLAMIAEGLGRREGR
jgi:antitoxin HicB